MTVATETRRTVQGSGCYAGLTVDAWPGEVTALYDTAAFVADNFTHSKELEEGYQRWTEEHAADMGRVYTNPIALYLNARGFWERETFLCGGDGADESLSTSLHVTVWEKQGDYGWKPGREWLRLWCDGEDAVLTLSHGEEGEFWEHNGGDYVAPMKYAVTPQVLSRADSNVMPGQMQCVAVDWESEERALFEEVDDRFAGEYDGEGLWNFSQGVESVDVGSLTVNDRGMPTCDVTLSCADGIPVELQGSVVTVGFVPPYND